MDKLSKVRRYLEKNPSVVALTPEALTYALTVPTARPTRRYLAEVLCAVITDAIGGNFGLGAGETWLTESAALLDEMLDAVLNADLLKEEEKLRGRAALKGPHTPNSVLLLLAKTEVAITARRTARAQQREQERSTLKAAA